MSYLKLFLLLILSTTSYSQYDSLNHDGLNRKYLLHLPSEYNENTPTHYPLVVAMHGGFGNAFNMESQSQFSNLADTSETPFIVVYPEGIISPLGISSWNSGECCGYASRTNVDDVGFISSLIILLEENYLIDTNMIYATGMSNGGMMSYRLAAELSDKIAAIAPVSSAMSYEEILEPSRAIPIIHFHSFIDTQIPIEGGTGTGLTDYNYLPLDSVLNVWANLNNCKNNNDTLYNKPGEYLYKVWKQCDNKANIKLYVTYDGGHSWPGGTQPRPEADLPSKIINANPLIWSFFLEHPKNKITNVENQKTINENFELHQNYPNPFNPTTIIKYSIPLVKEKFSSTVNVTLKVYDILGRHITTLVDEAKSSGNHKIFFNSTKLTSGIYFYKLKAGDFTITKKMILIR